MYRVTRDKGGEAGTEWDPFPSTRFPSETLADQCGEDRDELFIMEDADVPVFERDNRAPSQGE